MSEQTIRLEGLSSSQILDVIAEFLGVDHALDARILASRVGWLTEGWIHLDDAKQPFFAPDPYLTLPDTQARRGVKRGAGDPEELQRLWKTRNGRAVTVSDPARAQLGDHLERLALLLSGDPADSDLVVASETRRLVVGRGVDKESVRAMFRDLGNWVSAPARIAISQEATGGSDICVFDVNDDKSRDSSLESALVGSRFIALEGYEVEILGKRCWAFFPQGRSMSRADLRNFAYVWWQLVVSNRQQPDQTFEGRIPAENALLFACFPFDSAVILRLDHLHFSDRIRLAPIHEEAPREILVPRQTFDSNNKDHVADLRSRLALAVPPQGYRLSLDRYEGIGGGPSSEREQELQSEIERRMTELEFIRNASAHLRCEVLHRFSHRQLAAMVETLASYAPQKLSQIKYAYYEFSERFPEGAHFLLIDPSIDFHLLGPSLPYEEEYAETSFHLDPFWARHYAQAPNSARVYVPKGYTLYPSLHSFGINDMDAYLKEVFGERYHGTLGTQSIPSDPVYVFDPYGQDRNELAISVLSLADFRPVNTPRVVSFLVDLLHVIHKMKGAGRFVTVMARMDLRRQAFEEAKLSLADAETRFGDARDALRQRIESESASLVRDLNGALQDLIKRTAEFANEAALLNRRLSELKRLEQEVQGMVARSDRAYSDVKKAGSALDDATGGLRKTIETSVQDAERALGEAEGHYDRLEKLVQSKVAELTDRHAKLDAEFSKLRRVS